MNNKRIVHTNKNTDFRTWMGMANAEMLRMGSDPESVTPLRHKHAWEGGDTAWSPPIAWYHEMVDEHGFDVTATYFEPGMAFIGRYTTDGLDEYYEYGDLDHSEIEQEVPADLVEEYGLLDWINDDEDQEAEFEAALADDEEEKSE